jgi:hypothetical protein
MALSTRDYYFFKPTPQMFVNPTEVHDLEKMG